jgi:hypothetical protein
MVCFVNNFLNNYPAVQMMVENTYGNAVCLFPKHLKMIPIFAPGVRLSTHEKKEYFGESRFFVLRNALNPEEQELTELMKILSANSMK